MDAILKVWNYFSPAPFKQSWLIESQSWKYRTLDNSPLYPASCETCYPDFLQSHLHSNVPSLSGQTRRSATCTKPNCVQCSVLEVGPRCLKSLSVSSIKDTTAREARSKHRKAPTLISCYCLYWGRWTFPEWLLILTFLQALSTYYQGPQGSPFWQHSPKVFQCKAATQCAWYRSAAENAAEWEAMSMNWGITTHALEPRTTNDPATIKNPGHSCFNAPLISLKAMQTKGTWEARACTISTLACLVFLVLQV